MEQKRKVKCPTCKQQALFAPENEFRPFCTQRCRLIDLGEWAEESFKLQAEEQPTPEELEQAFLEKLRRDN